MKIYIEGFARFTHHKIYPMHFNQHILTLNINVRHFCSRILGFLGFYTLHPIPYIQHQSHPHFAKYGYGYSFSIFFVNHSKARCLVKIKWKIEKTIYHRMIKNVLLRYAPGVKNSDF